MKHKKWKEIQSHPTCNPDNKEPDDVMNAAEKELSWKSDCFMQKNLNRFESSLYSKAWDI